MPATTTTICLIDKFIKYEYKQDIILLLIFYRNMTRIRLYEGSMDIIGEFCFWGGKL